MIGTEITSREGRQPSGIALPRLSMNYEASIWRFAKLSAHLPKVDSVFGR